MRHRTCCVASLLLLAVLRVPGADGPALESLLPDDIVGYARVRGAGARLDEFLASGLRRELESLEPVKESLAHGPLAKLQEGLRKFEEATGQEPLGVLKALFGADVLVGARFGFSGLEVIAVSRGASPRAVEETLAAVRKGLENRGLPAAGATSTHEGKTIETFDDKLSFATLGDVIAIASSRSAVERVIDLAAGKSSASLRQAPAFRKEVGDAAGGGLVSLVVRPQFIPNFHIPGKVDNGLGSLLIGGWLGALEASDLIAVRGDIQGGEVELKLVSHLGEKARSDPAWQKYASFFPDVSRTDLRERLEKRGVLAVTELHRNIARWWESRESLVESRGLGGFAEFAQVMSIVFGGRNFQDEVLPEIGPTVTIVARNQEYKELAETPQPAIPAFAAIFEVKDAESASQDMVAAFYTLVGIINADQANKKKEGGMAMIPKPMKVGDVDMHTVALNQGQKGQKGQKPGMQHNFTPSLAVVGSRVILGSSTELTRILVEELGKLKEAATTAARAADTLVIDAAQAHAILRQNLDLIVADNMMKKGVSRTEAQAELDLALGLLQRLRGLRLDSAREGDAVTLRLRVRTAGGDKASSAEAGGRKAVKL